MYTMTPMLSAGATGIPEWFQNIFGSLISSGSSWIFFVGLVALIAGGMTNFMSCTVTANISWAVFGTLALSSGTVNPLALGVMIAIMANGGYMTPPASSAAAVYLGTDYLTPKDGLKYGGIFAICTILVGIIIVYPFANFAMPF